MCLYLALVFGPPICFRPKTLPYVFLGNLMDNFEIQWITLNLIMDEIMSLWQEILVPNSQQPLNHLWYKSNAGHALKASIQLYVLCWGCNEACQIGLPQSRENVLYVFRGNALRLPIWPLNYFIFICWSNFRTNSLR